MPNTYSKKLCGSINISSSGKIGPGVGGDKLEAEARAVMDGHICGGDSGVSVWYYSESTDSTGSTILACIDVSFLLLSSTSSSCTFCR